MPKTNNEIHYWDEKMVIFDSYTNAIDIAASSKDSSTSFERNSSASHIIRPTQQSI
jgi:hypothetical protein